MLEIYLAIFSLLCIIIILVHRFVISKKEEKIAFKEMVSAKVEEFKKMESEEGGGASFKEEHVRQTEAKKYDIAAFKEEMRKAELALAKKDFSEAKKFLIQAMALAKEELPVALKLGEIYMETDDLNKAESLYKKLLEEGVESAGIFENIGKIYLKRMSYKEAIQAYVKAVEMEPKDDRKLVALGKLYQLMMRFGVAAQCFRRAAEIKPRDADYLFLLAEACVADEDYENALFTYEKIMTIEPYNEKAKTASHDVRLKIKEQEALFKA